MVRLDKLLDAWRADPRVDATVELASMLLRASVKTKGALPQSFVVEFGDEAAQRHPRQLGVLDMVARLFAVANEGARAQALYARVASLFPSDPKVSSLESALREAGLAVPPPEVAAKLAGPLPEPLPPPPPPKKELPAPRPAQNSLAEFAPAARAGRSFPIEAGAFPIDMEPSTSDAVHNAPTKDAPPHAPEVPTRELEMASIERAIGEAKGDESIPRRPRAPTVSGLGLPAPPLPGPPPTVVRIADAVPADRSPDTALAPTLPGGGSAGARPAVSKTLMPAAGLAPPAPAFPAPPRVALSGAEDASPARMFTPVRAFTPPPGDLRFAAVTGRSSSGRGGAPTDLEEGTDSGETATGVMSPAARAAGPVFIDSPTTTQETITRPGPLAERGARPSVLGASPPTQTRVVPQVDQLKAAAASILGKGAGDASGPAPPSRAAARRGSSSGAADDDGPATGVTTTETEVTAAPTGAFDVLTRQRHAPGDAIDLGLDRAELEGGQATARRDTSELLAAALLPPSPAAAPALGAPSATPSPAAGGEGPRRPSASPARLAQSEPPENAPRAPARPPAAGPPVKPTLVSRPSPAGPPVKPTLVSPGGRAALKPPVPPPVAPPPPSPPSADAEDPSTLVRSPSAMPPPLDASTTFSQAITNLWDPKEKRTSPVVDPRREPDDDDGPATGVLDRMAPGMSAPRARPPAEEPSLVEELSADALQTLDEDSVAVGSPDTADPPTGKVEPRGKIRSTQKIAGTVAPAVAWSPPGQPSADFGNDEDGGGVRTKVLSAEESQQAGRVDPLPSTRNSDWVITPPPPVAPRFGPPPPSVRSGSASGGPASFTPLPPSSAPPQPYAPPPRGFAPSFGAPPASFGAPSPASPPSPRQEAETGAAAQEPRAQRAGASPILIGSLIGVALSVLVAGGVFLYDILSAPKKTATVEPVATEDIEGVLLGGRRSDLDRAVALLAASPFKGRERELSMLRLRERSLRALEEGSAEGLGAAMDAARAAGWTDEDLAFGELAKAVAARDPRSARGVQDRFATARRTDAFYLLAAGAAFEARGDAKAIDAYAAALGAEPRLRPAALRLARAELLEGDGDRGAARIEGLATPGGAKANASHADVDALRLLAWLRQRRDDPAKAGPAPTLQPAAEQLPAELRFVPEAFELATADPRPTNLKAALETAVGRADAPAVLVLFGEIALDLRAEAVALDIARGSLERAPEHAASLRLFAKSALTLAKLDLLDEVGKTLPVPQRNLLRGVVAYERGDITTVLEVRAWLAERDEPGREGIVARAERLLGKKPMNATRVQGLQRPEVIGGDLVAVDALLDAGDLSGAAAVVKGWGDPSGHPLRALRAARLYRYQGRPEEAEGALDVAAPTRPALVERLLLEADKPEERAHARSMLDARFGEDRRFLEVYLLAIDDQLPAAAKLLETLEVPRDEAPLSLRIAAAMALGAVGDQVKGRDLIRRLSDVWPMNPDVRRAARDFGRRR